MKIPEPISRILRDDKLVARLFSKGAADLCIKGFGLFALLGMNTLLARYMGVEAYGHFSFGLAAMMIVALVARQGMDSGILRLLPAYVAKQEWGLLIGVNRWMMKRVLVVALLLAVAGIVGIKLFRAELDPGLYTTLFWGFVFVPAIASMQMIQYALRGRSWIVLSQVPELVFRPLGVILIVVFSGFFGVMLDGGGAMQASLAASLFGICFGAAWFYQSLPQEALNAQPRYEAAVWRRISTPLLLVAGANLILNQSDVLILGLLTTTDQSGLYAAASRIAAITGFGLIALSSIGAPMISELYAVDKRAELARLAKLIARVSLATLLPMAFVLAMFGQSLLALFGPAFEAAYLPLLILIGGHAIAACFGASALLLTMTDYQSIAAKYLMLSVVINLALNFALIPIYGMVGAAIATALSMLIRVGAMAYTVKARMGINPMAF